MSRSVSLSSLQSSPLGKGALLQSTKQEVAKMQAQRKRTTTGGSNELAVRALNDITAFAELIGFHGGWSNFSSCHEELAKFITKPQVDPECQQRLAFEGDEYEGYLRRMVLMPRGHLKSTIGTVLYVLWRVFRNPEIRVMVGCNLQSLAYSFIRELRSHLENPELQDIWNKRPHIKGNLIPAIQKKSNARNFNLDTDAEDRKVIWNNVALQVVRDGKFKEPTIYATSVGTTITGMHFDLIILDDLVDFRNVESEQKKQQVEEWIADVESVVNPPRLVQVESDFIVFNDILGGEVLVNGTRYAVDDYYGQVIEKQQDLGYHVHSRNIYSNGKNSDDGYLWNERYNDKVVTSLRSRLSPRRFSSQYLNTVYEKDAHLFNVQAITIVEDSAIFRNNGRLCIRLPNGRVEILQPIIALDPAFSTSKTGDDCGIVVGSKLKDGSLVVIDAAVDRMTAAEVVEKVGDFATKYDTLRMYSELNGVGALVPEIFAPQVFKVNGRSLIVNTHYEQRPKESKIQGVLELPINSGKFIFCERVKGQERLWKQLSNYPGVRHDDFMDSLVTLYEKATASREVYKYETQLTEFNGVPLKLDFRKENKREGYINGYRAVQPVE